jgi:hypothetical protein
MGRRFQKQMSKLLLDSNPLVIIPELAVAVGLNESIILQQLHYWLQKSNHYYDGNVWIYNSIPEWCEQFPFLAQRTIERAMATLKSKGLIITGNYNKLKQDRTLWYSIDYQMVESISNNNKNTSKPHENSYRQNGGMVTTKWRDDNDKMGSPLPEITSEITTKINNKSVSQSPKENNDGQTDNVIQSIFKQSELYCYPDDKRKLAEESIRTVFFKSDIAYTLKIGLNHDQLKERLSELRINHLDRAFKKYEERKHSIKNTLIYFTKVLIESIAVAGAEAPVYESHNSYTNVND